MYVYTHLSRTCMHIKVSRLTNWPIIVIRFQNGESHEKNALPIISAFIMSQEYEPVLTVFKHKSVLFLLRFWMQQHTALQAPSSCPTRQKRCIVSKCTTDLSSPFLSRSSVCLVCRQETGFRVSVRSLQSWGNVEKGWGFWGFHKRGSRNLFETILHKIQHANRV